MVTADGKGVVMRRPLGERLREELGVGQRERGGDEEAKASDEDAIIIPPPSLAQDMRFLVNNKDFKDVTFIILLQISELSPSVHSTLFQNGTETESKRSIP